MDRVPSVKGNLGLGGILFQLVKGTGAKRVGAHQAALPALSLVVVRELINALASNTYQMHACLGTRRGLAGALQTDKHDDVGFAAHRLERLHAGINQPAELLKHRLLYDASAVQPARKVLEVDGGFDVFAQLLHQLDVDVGFQQGFADFLEHAIKDLCRCACA